MKSNYKLIVEEVFLSVLRIARTARSCLKLKPNWANIRQKELTLFPYSHKKKIFFFLINKAH